MTSRERVNAALRFEIPDRIPRFVWLSGEVKRRLAKKHGVSLLELEILLGNDILQSWVSINGEMERDVPQGTVFTDAFGVTWKRDGAYNMVVRHPLSGLDADGVRAWRPPNPHASERYKQLEFLVRAYGREYFIGADVSGTLFEPACHLRGMDDLMLDMASCGEEADLLLDKLAEFSIAVALESLERSADWIWLGDDLGSQHGMLISPGMWRAYMKPRMRRIIHMIRRVKPEVPIVYHSCGSIAPIIGDLVEIGVNVLNPLQEGAAGMNQEAVQREYKGRLTLMCGLDTQRFMPVATPPEIFRATRDKIKTLGADNGYIFAVSHHIQGDVPDENIEAMFQALSEEELLFKKGAVD